MNVATTSSLKANLRNGIEVCDYAVEASSFIVSEVDPLEKTLKVVSKSLTLSSFVKPSEASALINTQLKDTISLIETVSFCRNLQSVVRPNKEGKYFFQDPANSWQKCVARVSLLAHSTLKLFVAAKKWKMINLGIASKFLIGKLPFFTLVTDGLYGLYNFFGAWDNVKVLMNCHKALMLVEKKIGRLEEREKNLKKIAICDPSQITVLKEKCVTKIQSLQKLAETSDTSSEKVAAKIAKLPLWQARLDKIAKGDYQMVADDIRKEDIAPKLNKWKFEKHTIQLNRNKALLAFGSTSAKASSVALTLFFVAMNLWVTPSIILVTTLSLIGDSCGITRILKDKFPAKFQEPKKASV